MNLSQDLKHWAEAFENATGRKPTTIIFSIGDVRVEMRIDTEEVARVPSLEPNIKKTDYANGGKSVVVSGPEGRVSE